MNGINELRGDPYKRVENTSQPYRGTEIPERECLNVGTVPTYNMHNIGTVPTFKMHNIGTVPMFKMHNVGTPKNYDLYFELEFRLYGKNK